MKTDRPSKPSSLVRSYAQASQYIGAGIQLAVSVFLCLLGGIWLDRRLDTLPLFLILGTLLGAAAGFYNLYAVVTGAERQRRREQEQGTCGKA